MNLKLGKSNLLNLEVHAEIDKMSIYVLSKKYCNICFKFLFLINLYWWFDFTQKNLYPAFSIEKENFLLCLLNDNIKQLSPESNVQKFIESVIMWKFYITKYMTTPDRSKTNKQ